MQMVLKETTSSFDSLVLSRVHRGLPVYKLLVMGPSTGCRSASANMLSVICVWQEVDLPEPPRSEAPQAQHAQPVPAGGMHNDSFGLPPVPQRT